MIPVRVAARFPDRATTRPLEEKSMQSATQTAPASKAMFWAGWVLTALPSLFLVMDGVMKLVKPDFVVQKTTELGFSEGVILPLGVVLLACTALYVIPQTAVLGAILLTGYLGGAVCTHVRSYEGLFPVFFPVVFGAVLWVALLLRDARLRALLPLRR
jgi:DoxX-like family